MLYRERKRKRGRTNERDDEPTYSDKWYVARLTITAHKNHTSETYKHVKIKIK